MPEPGHTPEQMDSYLNRYVPERAEVLAARRLSEEVVMLSLRAAERPPNEFFSFCSGQFVMLSLPGIGEAPFSLCSSPTEHRRFEISVRAAGNVSRALHRLLPGDSVWFRGPYGQGFPLTEMAGRDLLFIAGGIGLAPLRSALGCAVCLDEEFGDITLLVGARHPGQLLFTDEYDAWRRRARVEVTVDEAPPGWEGRRGLITGLIDEAGVSPDRASALVCGPPVMYRFVLARLKELGFDDADIYVSLERNMRCGVGKCEHCVVESFYTCREGPVLSAAQIRGISSALR